jgi:hypothetical protein
MLTSKVWLQMLMRKSIGLSCRHPTMAEPTSQIEAALPALDSPMRRRLGWGMKFVKTLIAIAAIGVGSQAFGKAYPGLEVGFTFREMDVVVEDPGEEAKTIRLTRADIERTVKLKLLTRGFKVVPTGDDSPTGSYLYIVVNNIGEAVSISVRFEKLAAHFGIPNDRGTGSVFAPGQGT